MIYLSGAMPAEKIGNRKDIGIMIGFRQNGKFWGKTKRLNRCIWAADNGCFTNPNLNVDDYLAWLKSLSEIREVLDDNTEHSIIENCLFATAPDVVGDAKETWKRSAPVLPQIRALGYAAAFVAQDGIEDETIHWDSFDSLFIGGSTEWKESEHAKACVKAAKAIGKWVHIGRVNSASRFTAFEAWGADSCDGSGIARYSHMREKMTAEPPLFNRSEMVINI